MLPLKKLNYLYTFKSFFFLLILYRRKGCLGHNSTKESNEKQSFVHWTRSYILDNPGRALKKPKVDTLIEIDASGA